MSDEVKKLVEFICGTPVSDEVLDMDCNLYCEKMARIADRVAAGERLCDLLPELEQHLADSPDAREEFEALLCVLRAERSGALEDTHDPIQP